MKFKKHKLLTAKNILAQSRRNRMKTLQEKMELLKKQHEAESQRFNELQKLTVQSRETLLKIEGAYDVLEQMTKEQEQDSPVVVSAEINNKTVVM